MPLEWGNGLTGMRERIGRLRGQLSVGTRKQSLQIDIVLPAA